MNKKKHKKIDGKTVTRVICLILVALMVIPLVVNSALFV